MSLVLVISYSSAMGGSERILLDTAPGLAEEVCLACPEGPLAEEWRNRGLRVFPLRAGEFFMRGGVLQRLRAARDLLAHARDQRKLIDNVRPGLVVAWGMRSAVGCTLLGRLPVPVVFQHNDTLPGRSIKRAVRAAARRADLVLTLSRTIAKDLDPSGALQDRLRVIHPGVDVASFKARTPPALPPEVLVLGAIVPWKRPDFALDVLDQLRQSHPEVEVRLRVIGSPLASPGAKLLDTLLERVRENGLDGAVEFAPATGDTRTEIERASCLLHCAPREPFGMVVLEALACGRPVIVPNRGGPAEIVDSSCAVLYPPGAAGAAADGIARLITDPGQASAMGARGRELVSQRFELAQTQTEYAQAIAPLIRDGPRSGGLPLSDGTGASPRVPEVAIVTVTHNSAQVLERLLSSVRRHLPDARVIVVDSGSEDESLSLARSAPHVLTIEAGSNVGFGAACNLGIAEANEEVTILLNPDVELIDDSLLSLAIEAARREDRLFAPLVLNPDGSRQDTVHPAPGSAPELVRSVVPPALAPRGAAKALAPWVSSEPERVGWAVGCALAAQTQTLKALGPFDERIFLYGEDLDLGLRATDEGVDTWFWPDARVIHHRSHTTHLAFGGEPFEMLARARREVIRRRRGPWQGRLDDAAQAITFVSRIVLKRMLGLPAARERRQLQALAAVLRGEQ